MNENKYKLEITVQAFLKEVEDKLPGWLKDDKFEKHEVLNELEEHLWDKAEDLAGGEDINEGHIHQAITSMGNPERIGKEYKKRGTPHVYITKEWWELSKVLLDFHFFPLIAINVMVAFRPTDICALLGKLWFGNVRHVEFHSSYFGNYHFNLRSLEYGRVFA